jgi:hypothetical protein
MGQPLPGTRPSEKPAEERLDSWKAIAQFLGRDVTTVQRWEKREGMPVHRHLHDKRGSVYALAAELDAWLQGRRQSLAAEQDEKEPKPETAITPLARYSHGRFTRAAGCRLHDIPGTPLGECGATQNQVLSGTAFEEPVK